MDQTEPRLGRQHACYNNVKQYTAESALVLACLRLSSSLTRIRSGRLAGKARRPPGQDSGLQSATWNFRFSAQLAKLKLNPTRGTPWLWGAFALASVRKPNQQGPPRWAGEGGGPRPIVRELVAGPRVLLPAIGDLPDRTPPCPLGAKARAGSKGTVNSCRHQTVYYSAACASPRDQWPANIRIKLMRSQAPVQ
ncbi:hypothetical protein VTN96DRAFT_4522 [Rasamsonia emersonii]